MLISVDYWLSNNWLKIIHVVWTSWSSPTCTRQMWQPEASSAEGVPVSRSSVSEQTKCPQAEGVPASTRLLNNGFKVIFYRSFGKHLWTLPLLTTANLEYRSSSLKTKKGWAKLHSILFVFPPSCLIILIMISWIHKSEPLFPSASQMELPETPTAADTDVSASRTLHHHSLFPFMAQLFNKGQMTDLKELQLLKTRICNDYKKPINLFTSYILTFWKQKINISIAQLGNEHFSAHSVNTINLEMHF